MAYGQYQGRVPRVTKDFPPRLSPQAALGSGVGDDGHGPKQEEGHEPRGVGKDGVEFPFRVESGRGKQEMGGEATDALPGFPESALTSPSD